MNTSELQTFLRELWLQGVELWAEGDQLRFKGNKQLLAGDALKVLREHKADILALLQQQPLAYSGFALSHGQRAIYLMQSMAPESAAYNQACLLKLTDDLDISLLESSLDVLLQRHAPLRMSIEKLDGHIAQQVSYSLPSILSVHTLPGHTDWQQWLDNEADKPFRLDSEPLIRAQLLKTDSQPAQYHLLLVVHHIIADFWAMNLIIRELESIYLAEQTNQLPDLPDIGKLYKDYVLYEQEWLRSEQGQAARDYWHQQLSPVPPVPELPTDFARPSRPAFKGQEISFHLGSALTQQLKQQAKSQQVTPFVWVLSCYQLLMHRYSGENDIAIGSPVACRLQKDFQLLAGHFTNPVVLRTRFDQMASFHALLEHNKAQVLQAMKHQQYPLQLLIEELKPEHDLHNSPFFQAAISWNQLTENPVNDGRLIDHVERMEQRGAVYQLVLTCYDKGDDIQVSWRFNSDLYQAASITRFHEHLINIIKSSHQNNTLAIADFDFRTDEEKATLARINNTWTDIPRGENIASIFVRCAEAFPDNIAYKNKKNCYSYAQLDQYSNQIAHYLHSINVKNGDHIAICLDRSFDLLACILAVLKSGCTYIPIDPVYPEERLRHILELSNACALITNETHGVKITTEKLSKGLIFIEAEQTAIKSQPGTFSIYNNGHIEEDDPACIIFTSGSTGKPKGAVTPHRSLVRLGIDNGFMDIRPGDLHCYVCNVSFDAANIEIWGALLNGGGLLHIDTETILNPPAFFQLMAEEKPRAIFTTTSLFHLLVDYRADIFQHLDYVTIGGEALSISHARKCWNNGQGGNPVHLVNMYGPTENGTVSTLFYMHNLRSDDTAVPIGTPNNNSQIYIHDNYGKPCPFGIIGEIILAGEGVVTGYANQPELTTEKFSPDHYRGKGLLYRTGDLGYMRADGLLMYSGRIDNQVKIRGYRIEIGEVEQAIARIDEVNNYCVVTGVDAASTHYLAVYYTSSSALETHELKQKLRKILPEFMLPSAFMCLDKLPITPNGKVDKRQLPKITISRVTEYVAPRNSQEQALADIWQTLLGMEKIGIYDNFFELGGHSLLAVRLTSAIQAELHIDINMRMIFEHPDIASLSTAISQPGSVQLPPVSASQSTAPVPASLTQQRLWFLQQLTPSSAAYNMPLALLFSKPLKPALLEKAVRTLIQRHDALHSTLQDHEGEAWLHQHNDENWQLSQLDFSQMPLPQAKERAQEQIRLLANHAFDLQQGPLIKAVLIKLNARQQILAFCLHHIIVDGWSVNILLNELAMLLDNNGNALPPLPVQYSDFSLWQHQWLNNNILQNQLAYWQTALAGAPPLLNLPTDKPRPPALGTGGAEWHFTLNKKTIDPLRQLARQHNASLFMIMLSGFAILLNRYSQQDDICIGFPISGRNQKALEPVIGLFVNNLVIRSQFDQQTTVVQHIENVRKATLDAFANQDVPFDSIIDALKLERSLSYTPLLQVSFALEEQSFAERIQQSLGDQVELLPLDWHVAKYDINLTCFEQSNGDISACLDYSTDLYEADSMMRMAEHYRQILGELATQLATPVHRLQLQTAEEQQQALNSLIQRHKTQSHSCINAVNRFEVQAAQFARRTALSFENQHISYQSLNEQSNRLARVLQQNGIGSGDFVGLYLDRSPDIIISILAILKTGAAYIPLDPHSPAERVQFIIQDAGIRHIISHSNSAATLDSHCLLLDALANDCAAQPVDNLNIHLPPDSPAYVIYTSGTTGKPKGCIVSHRNLARLFTISEDHFGFNEQDVWTLFHSCAFDFSVWEIWGALLYGGRLVIVPHWMSRSPDAFYQLLADQHVTILNQTPSAFSQLITIDQQQTQPLSLRCIIFGGEALDFTALQQWVKQHPLTQTRLINMYGITETTVHVTFHEVSLPELHRGRSIIGTPLDDLSVWLLDPYQQPVPDGIIGEMYISGAGVTQGYLNRPELTAERFIANPFITGLPAAVAAQHQRLYRSGDLARRLANGNLEYLGRCDHQVKIRGHRIEPGEIEAALNSIAGIQESLVQAMDDRYGHKQLVAWLLRNNNTDTDALDIRLQLKALLPDYMIPAAFVTVQEWPLTANGKIDSARLPAPEASTSHSEYIAPRNDTELTLSAIWSDILDLEKVGIRDNFFELGGHSLLATRVAARIRNQLECQLELRLIFENPTIEELALAILEQELDALDMGSDELQSLLRELDHTNN